MPNAPNQSFARSDRVEPQESLQRDGIGSRLLQEYLRNIDQRRTTLRDEGGRELPAGAIGHIKCAAVCIENARSALDDEPMQFLRSNRFPEGFAQTVQEIEDERFLDLDFLMRALQPANPPRLEVGSDNPPGHRRDKQSKEKSRPHCAEASLLRRRLVMKVLS